MNLSFLTIYRSAKNHPLLPLSPQDCPSPPLMFAGWLSKRLVRRLPTHPFYLIPTATPPKSDQICSLFSNMAQFPGSRNIKTKFTI